MKVTTVLATRGKEHTRNGLITFEIEIPYYTWVELLTHKRIARNSSSARAQSLERHATEFYTPPVFLKQGEFMSSSSTPANDQEKLRQLWEHTWRRSVMAATAMQSVGVAKEQYNRLIPAFKYVRGVVTATEGGWREFLKLRTRQPGVDQPDQAMIQFAEMIQINIDLIQWRIASSHIPYADDLEVSQNTKMIAAARIARVSKGRPKGGQDDLGLAERLLRNKHMSPFEHIAQWEQNPIISAIACKPTFRWGRNPKSFRENDDLTVTWHGWTSFRAQLEYDSIP
jgi:thymidylate synthase ThyX